jgi:NADH:ubiquinone oxidoreductase subunit 4 (subunit M)
MPAPAWNLSAPFLSAVAICVPWFASILVAAYRRHTRVIGFLAALVSVVASALLLRAAPKGESLYEALMLLFSCLTLGATLVLPRRDCTAGTIGGILFILGSTLLALKGRSPGGMAAFGLLVLAVIFRKGICPAHAWVADAAEGGPLIPTALLLNGHFGALLVAKLIVPLFQSTTGNLFPVLSYLAVATAIYVAIRALTENSPRRLLAFLALSQSACILAGLESRTAEGITGALVHWFVVTVSTLGLFGILRLLEVRFGENLTASHHLGLAEHAPRLAVFFAVFGLALVGLPGTLSFFSQDLLIHGTLMSHPLTGLLLPIATAMNAVSVFRLFTRLFLGKRRTGFTVMADALPRERWILTAGVLFVVLGGLFPNAIVAQRSTEADIVGQVINKLTRRVQVPTLEVIGPAKEPGR